MLKNGFIWDFTDNGSNGFGNFVHLKETNGCLPYFGNSDLDFDDSVSKFFRLMISSETIYWILIIL